MGKLGLQIFFKGYIKSWWKQTLGVYHKLLEDWNSTDNTTLTMEAGVCETFLAVSCSYFIVWRSSIPVSQIQWRSWSSEGPMVLLKPLYLWYFILAEHFLHSGRSQLQAYNCIFSVTNIVMVIRTLCVDYQASICSVPSLKDSASQPELRGKREKRHLEAEHKGSRKFGMALSFLSWVFQWLICGISV